MSPPLGDNETYDRFATSETSLPLTPVYSRLVHPPVYHPIPKIRSELFDRFAECSLDGRVEFVDSLLIESVSRRLRVNPNFPERFIDIDVTEAGENTLVEQDGFNFTRPLVEDLLEGTGGESLIERLRSKMAHYCLGVSAESHTAKLPGVIKSNTLARIKLQAHTVVFCYRKACGNNIKRATHPEMNEKKRLSSGVKLHANILAPSEDGSHSHTSDSTFK